MNYYKTINVRIVIKITLGFLRIVIVNMYRKLLHLDFLTIANKSSIETIDAS